MVSMHLHRQSVAPRVAESRFHNFVPVYKSSLGPKP